MDEFYIEKFMEIQRQNVVLSNLLRDIHDQPELKELVEQHLGPTAFDILKDTPA